MIGVIGGTGTTGRGVVAALQAKGADFRCLVRDLAKAAETLGSDVELVQADVDDPASLIIRATVDDLTAGIADGTISGGMVPKVRSCIAAVSAGAASVHMLDGRIPHALLLEILTDGGVGTQIAGASR